MAAPMLCLSHPRRSMFILSTALSLFLCYAVLRSSSGVYIEGSNVEYTQKVIGVSPPCHHIRGMNDILVVLKTGATEALEKVPVHIDTTLKCVPHYVIFSDYEEEIAGVRTYDVLRTVREETKNTDSDFALYNRLQAQGRQGLQADDWKDDVNGPLGKPGNPGWKLDKWKFVPMLDEARLVKPDAKWYVFIEADSYVVWPNLVAWLSQLNHSQPYYLGSPMQIGDTTFAYGGSGIILSSEALHRVSKHRAEWPTEVEEITTRSWAGDSVLGKVLHDVDVPLLWSWPLLLTSPVWEFDHFAEGYGRRPWCYPVVSYHHMTPEDIKIMSHFQHQWFGNGEHSLLLHKDVFGELVFNATLLERDNWDNLSTEPAILEGNDSSIITAGDCAQQCDQDPHCLQFSFENNKCTTSKTVFKGLSRQGVHSGWMNLRIQALLSTFGSCSEAQYILG
ncbi:hypothetical protein BBP40_000305 [Aspergillus hancockii]|nr:hypothetical protein BBP40_000305 [Aspergillus hancockii]